MSFGPVNLGSFATTDIVAPGMPIVNSYSQVGNSTMLFNITLPLADSDGTQLTGLSGLTLAIAPMDGDFHPFESLNMEQILSLNPVNVQLTVTPDMAGSVVELEIPIPNLGAFHGYAVACND